MATERKGSPFSRDVSGRWTANVTTAGEERCGESMQGRGLRERMTGQRHFVRIAEGAGTDNGDRGWGGFPRQNGQMYEP